MISYLGAMMVAGIPAGMYTTNSPDACYYVSSHSKARVVVLDGNEQLRKYSSLCSRLPSLRAIVVWGESPDPALASSFPVPVHSYDDFLTLGIDVPESTVTARMDAILPGHCATLIYTSGTTGPPKGAMLSHDNVAWTCRVFANSCVGGAAPGRVVSYLPLSHIAAQMIDIHYGLYSATTSYFAQPDALKGSLPDTLKDVRPTVFFGVPRVWEKMQEKLVEIGRQSTGAKKMVADWAKSRGTWHCKYAEFGAGGGGPLGYSLAHAAILSKIKEALGLDQCKAFFTAAAPISVETLNYFASLDIPVFELFGQTECTGPHTSSRTGAWRVGYCGRPLPGTISKIVPDTGEVCYKGRHIFMGYIYMPEQTASTFDEDGFLHSGDVAEFDNNDDPGIPNPSGFLKITGRIKDLIITAGGENIPPCLIEEQMAKEMPALSNCFVIGDRRKFLTALVSLKTVVDLDTGEPTSELAPSALFIGEQIGSSAKTTQEAAADPLWTQYVTEGVKAVNARTTSRAQVIQKWKFLPRDFSERGGTLTPTLKVKRNVVCDMYAQLIDSLYE
jgi:long-chain-fatty-acid--CoA ligase ACSBG